MSLPLATPLPSIGRSERLNHQLRGELLHALQAGDVDPSVKVMIVRGAGKCFSAGYDLGGGNAGQDYPFPTAGGDSQWPRHVVEGWMKIWDLAKPVIAQVHGYCLAGGSELATGCDLVTSPITRRSGYPPFALRARYAISPWPGAEQWKCDRRFPER
jgi:enoyl-CoA hydratase